MKKNSASQSAFLNLRVLIGLFIVLAGVFLALLGFHDAQAQQPDYAKTTDPLVPANFDCSTIAEKGIDKQENLIAGAIMIACGEAEGGKVTPLGAFFKTIKELVEPDLGNTDRDLITGTETSPNITQSETFTAANPDNLNQIVVAYNDSRGRNATPINISGASVSTDGGATFTRLTAAGGQGPFPNTSGDPVVLYNRPTGTLYTVWLDGACGGQGLGGFKSTTPADPSPASWTHYCVHSGGSDDRESGWADNNPSSPFYGRMYVSWNDFAASQFIYVRYSTDNGITWTNQRQITTSFIRNVQITGDIATGAVYIAGMDEMGGGLTNRANKIYRSTDGGNTWTNTYTGPTFPGPGRSASGFFATMYSSPAYWRHMGWGQPAALNGVVSYVYAARNTGTGDPGDVFYIRSTDLGVTFSAPFQLNTNVETNKAQWQPNLSVTSSGSLLAVWYDERERVAASCQPSSPSTPCYRMWGRKSNDNGATWLPDEAFSDVVSPLPLQPDPGIVGTYVGDYDYASSAVNQHFNAWADGRVSINSASQQDAFTDKEISGFAVSSTVPAVGSVISTQPTMFVVNVTDPAQPATLQGSDFTVNGTPATSVTYTPGTMTMTFNFTVSPVVTQGLQTMHINAGAFLKDPTNEPITEFTGTFRYDATQLMVTTTNPAVNGNFTPAAPNDYQYDVNFNEALDPASVQTTDLMVTGNSAPTVMAVTVINSNMTARFTLHMNFGGVLTASIAAGAVTDAFGNSNLAFSGNYTVEGCPPQDHYNITQIGGSIVPGTTDIGNHGDDVVTTIALPFSYSLFDQVFGNITLSSNGTAQFTTTDTSFSNVCLPWTTHNYTILPYWDDQRTDANTGCAGFPGGTCGIFTSTSGTAPNRIFNIEWRTVYFGATGSAANHELRLYEGQARFDVIYGAVAQGNTPATAGVQKNNTAFDQYFCNGSGGAATGGQSYIITPCGPTPTATATSTGTPSPTPTATATATATATVPPSPTPTATATACGTNYGFTVTPGATIIPGTVDTGNHVDDGSTVIALPFAYTLYDQTFNNVAVGSNGHLTFGVVNNTFTPTCLPLATATYAILPYETDLCSGACFNDTGTNLGIFTSVSGTAPNRIFNVEYRVAYYNSNQTTNIPINFEVRLFEGQTAFDVIYATVPPTFTPPAARILVVGVQRTSATQFTQEGCDTTGGTMPPVSDGQLYHYTLGSCPSPTPTAVSISGTVLYCTNPVPGPVPNVTMTLTGTASGSTLTDASGNYSFTGLPSGGNYTVTPSKAARVPGSSNINTSDVVAVQRHFLNIGTPLTGCKLRAADVNGDTLVNTSDVIAIQRFFLGLLTGVANTGRYDFTPPTRTYMNLVTNQTAQGYDTIVFGDVAANFVELPEGPAADAPGSGSSVGDVAAVTLPDLVLDQSKSNLTTAVKTSAIDANSKLVGFQGDFTFDERVVTFQSEPVQKAGLTAGNWNVSGNVLPGSGPIRTLRISAYSGDFAPLSGEGTLFELKMSRVNKAAQSMLLNWAAAPDQFVFIDADLNTHTPGNAAPGNISPSKK